MAEQSRKQIISPRTPYFYYNPLLGRPFNIIVSGFIPQGADEFASINLAAHTNKEFPLLSLPFHLSIRPKDGELVRNSYISGKGWAAEERGLLTDALPLHFGAKFDLILASNDKEITVTINGQLAFKFAHRADPKQINLFEIQGSVFIESVCFDFL